jgi:hypothetical protein
MGFRSADRVNIGMASGDEHRWKDGIFRDEYTENDVCS